MIDPLDKLIASVQGNEIRDPVPMPDGARPASDFDEVPRYVFTSANEPNRLLLFYREIISRKYGSSEGDKLGDWKTHKVAISTLLSVLETKQRESFVLKIALEAGIGQYPKVLFAFEWFDARMQKSLRQEIKDGFVRG